VCTIYPPDCPLGVTGVAFRVPLFVHHVLLVAHSEVTARGRLRGPTGTVVRYRPCVMMYGVAG
jgi:hypothetical protein